MAERIYRTEAVVLRRTSFSEADRLLVLATPHGKQRVIAKGARKTSSRLAGHIELFVHAQMLLAVGRNLDIVTQSTIVHDFASIRGDLERISAAYYIAELWDRLIEEDDENPKAFRHLLSALEALDTNQRIDLVLRWYELHILDALGFRPQLSACPACHTVLTEEDNRFSPQSGGVLCRNCAPADRKAIAMSLGAFKLLRFLQQQPIDVIGNMTISEALCAEAEKLIAALLKTLLERDLKSLTFLREVRKE